MAARQASIFAWADSGEPITGNPQPKRSNASFDKNRELDPRFYKLCEQRLFTPTAVNRRARSEHLQARARHRTREDAELERYQRSAARRPRSGEIWGRYGGDMGEMRAAARRPRSGLRIPVSRTSAREGDTPSAVLETVFSCQHCTRSLCTHAVLRVQSRHTLCRAPAPSCWCIQHVVGSPRPQPAGSKPSARSGGRLTRMMADASEQEARACELLSSSLTATADARRAHRFLSSGALPFSHCVPRCHAVCAAIWERTSLSHTRQNYV